eukprot:scaffold8998_cov13-Tisochrysis_lutea.AAC.1
MTKGGWVSHHGGTEKADSKLLRHGSGFPDNFSLQLHFMIRSQSELEEGLMQTTQQSKCEQAVEDTI